MNLNPKTIQHWIHSIEAGVGLRRLRWSLALLLTGIILGSYLLTEARNFQNPEAMEKAVIARNLATARGYTTLSVHPVAIRLLEETARKRELPDPKVLRGPVPDLQHPPVYPVLLSGLFRMLPRAWLTQLPSDVSVHRPKVEHAITLFNLAWLGWAVFLTQRMGARWFNPEVGWFAALALGFTELFWRMASNGLETNFLLVLVLVCTRTMRGIVLRGPPVGSLRLPPLQPLLSRAAFLGGVIGVGCLTRYSFAWILLPILVFLFRYSSRRVPVLLTSLATFVLVISPWLIRNERLSGHVLGTAGLAAQAMTMTFPADTLERSLQAPTETAGINDLRVKFSEQISRLLKTHAANPGGNWLWFFFLTGLLVPYSKPLLNRLRFFTLSCLATFFCAQALGTTHLSDHGELIHSENLVCLTAPLFILFGSAFLFNLLESTYLRHALLKPTCVGGVWAVVCLPLLSSALPPRSFPMVQPVYRPDIVQAVASFVEPDDLMMSDIPWAVAWYGNRTCLWLTRHVQGHPGEDFFDIHDFRRQVQALYLSPFTTGVPVREMVVDIENHRWAWMYLDALARGNLPRGFPLRVSYQGSARAGHLYLADRQRW